MGNSGHAAFDLLNEIVEFARCSGVVSKKISLENAMRYLTSTLCSGITQQVLATDPLHACLDGHGVIARLPIPTDDDLINECRICDCAPCGLPVQS